jgi:hypothetical protein
MPLDQEPNPQATIKRSSWAAPSFRSAADLPITTLLSGLDWANDYNDVGRCEALIVAIYRTLDHAASR